MRRFLANLSCRFHDVAPGGRCQRSGEITRSDGIKQTTYKGWPLYYFVSDNNAGDTKGEGVNRVWFVAHEPWYTVALLSQQNGPTYLTDSGGRALKGHPLYYFTGDVNPGDTNGRHLFNLWEIIDPSQL